MSSAANRGYASRRSSNSAPSASLRSRSFTGIRVPRITGLPCMTLALISTRAVMVDSASILAAIIQVVSFEAKCKRFQNPIDFNHDLIYCHNLGMLIRTIALLVTAAAAPTEPEVLKLSGDVEGVHDPVIIKQKDTYYVFCTGRGRDGAAGIIPIRTSKDLIHWTNAGTALPGIPDWGKREIPGARDAWAPDISYYKGKYHLYYALSTFGSQNSAIGLATNL